VPSSGSMTHVRPTGSVPFCTEIAPDSSPGSRHPEVLAEDGNDRRFALAIGVGYPVVARFQIGVGFAELPPVLSRTTAPARAAVAATSSSFKGLRIARRIVYLELPVARQRNVILRPPRIVPPLEAHPRPKDPSLVKRHNSADPSSRFALLRMTATSRQLATAPLLISLQGHLMRTVGHYRIVGKSGRRRDGRGLPRRGLATRRHGRPEDPPADFVQDPDRIRRFQKEARAASALSHPNILTIYEVGVDGETTTSPPNTWMATAPQAHRRRRPRRRFGGRPSALRSRARSRRRTTSRSSIAT